MDTLLHDARRSLTSAALEDIAKRPMRRRSRYERAEYIACRRAFLDNASWFHRMGDKVRRKNAQRELAVVRYYYWRPR